MGKRHRFTFSVMESTTDSTTTSPITKSIDLRIAKKMSLGTNANAEVDAAAYDDNNTEFDDYILRSHCDVSICAQKIKQCNHDRSFHKTNGFVVLSKKNNNPSIILSPDTHHPYPSVKKRSPDGMCLRECDKTLGRICSSAGGAAGIGQSLLVPATQAGVLQRAARTQRQMKTGTVSRCRMP
jgi:hypothetical protein